MALINCKVGAGSISNVAYLGRTDAAATFNNLSVGDIVALAGEKSFDPGMSAVGMNLLSSDLTSTCKFYLYEVTSTTITVSSSASTYLFAFKLS